MTTNTPLIYQDCEANMGYKSKHIMGFLRHLKNPHKTMTCYPWMHDALLRPDRDIIMDPNLSWRHFLIL